MKHILLILSLLVCSLVSAQGLEDRNISETVAPTRKIHLAVKTNTLYDIAAIPNLGLEVNMGRRWSLSANWMYAWWHNDNRHWYWRIYGGDVSVRKWCGKKSKERSLSGHHVGVYAQILTYDFEWGGRGYLADRWTYGGGLEYGYSLPIGKRLNLDFTLGIGYLTGEYMEYDPIDRCYVWQFTKKQNWIGPTKVEVSLVWLLDSSMFKKGGGK